MDSLLLLGFSTEVIDLLKEKYAETRQEVRNIQKEMAVDLPEYVNLDWRLDIQVASKNARDLLNPLFLVQLQTKFHDSISHLLY